MVPELPTQSWALRDSVGSRIGLHMSECILMPHKNIAGVGLLEERIFMTLHAANEY